MVLILVLMIFMLATWSISPAQQLYLVTLAPRNPDIALSVNTSFIQFGFALGSGLGGISDQSYLCPIFKLAGVCRCMHSFTSCQLLFKKSRSRTGTPDPV